MPIRHMHHVCPGLKYLEEAILIVCEWKQSGKVGLTAKTFKACIQSMTAIQWCKSLLSIGGDNLQFHSNFALFLTLGNEPRLRLFSGEQN